MPDKYRELLKKYMAYVRNTKGRVYLDPTQNAFDEEEIQVLYQIAAEIFIERGQ